MSFKHTLKGKDSQIRLEEMSLSTQRSMAEEQDQSVSSGGMGSVEEDRDVDSDEDVEREEQFIAQAVAACNKILMGSILEFVELEIKGETEKSLEQKQLADVVIFLFSSEFR